MSDWQLFIGVAAVITWASLPVSIIYSMAVFDHDVVKEGEEAGHH